MVADSDGNDDDDWASGAHLSSFVDDLKIKFKVFESGVELEKLLLEAFLPRISQVPPRVNAGVMSVKAEEDQVSEAGQCSLNTPDQVAFFKSQI